MFTLSFHAGSVLVSVYEYTQDVFQNPPESTAVLKANETSTKTLI